MPHTGPAATQPKLKSLVHSDVLGRLNWHNPAMPFIYTFETATCEEFIPLWHLAYRYPTFLTTRELAHATGFCEATMREYCNRHCDRFPDFVKMTEGSRRGLPPSAWKDSRATHNQYGLVLPELPVPLAPAWIHDSAEAEYHKEMMAAIPEWPLVSEVARFLMVNLVYHSERRRCVLIEKKITSLVRSSARYINVHAHQLNSGRNDYPIGKRDHPCRTWSKVTIHKLVLSWERHWTSGGKQASRIWRLPPTPEGFPSGEAAAITAPTKVAQTTGERILEALTRSKDIRELVNELHVTRTAINSAGDRLQRQGLIKKRSKDIDGLWKRALWERVTPPVPADRKRQWLESQLTERGWTKRDLARFNGPDHKTVDKYMRGEPVYGATREKIALALSQKIQRVRVEEVP